MHDFHFAGGRLWCGSVDLARIAREVGTPCFVYSAEALRSNFRRMDSALAGLENRLICYAVKANSNLAVLDVLRRAGSGFDIVSGGELYRVLCAGGRAANCTFAGVGKSTAEVALALREGVYCINVESEAELDRIERMAAREGVQAPVAVRVNPDVDAGTHEFISTGRSQNKFGIGLDRARDVYARAAACPHVKLRGVQTHIGSQITSPQPFAEALEKLLPLVSELRDTYGIEFFSVGGGVGIAYEHALASGNEAWWSEREDALTPEAYARAVVGPLSKLGMRILFEPGRSLCGNAGVLLTTVEYVKRSPSKTFAIVDASMTELIRPALYDGYHEIVPLEAREGTEVVDVVGPVCESGDFLAKGRELPILQEGDQLAVMSAGAYGAVMGSNYNARPLAAEVLVEGGGFHIVRKRQSLAEMLAGERVPDYSSS
jgi:diaminopimelate decarboxylase